MIFQDSSPSEPCQFWEENGWHCVLGLMKTFSYFGKCFWKSFGKDVHWFFVKGVVQFCEWFQVAGFVIFFWKWCYKSFYLFTWVFRFYRFWSWDFWREEWATSSFWNEYFLVIPVCRRRWFRFCFWLAFTEVFYSWRGWRFRRLVWVFFVCDRGA